MLRGSYELSNHAGLWYLYYRNGEKEVDLALAKFDDKKKLIEEVSKIKLGEKSIEDIFNKELYEEDSLFI